MLDIDRWLIVCFSFTDKLVSKIMRASWGHLYEVPRMHPIDAIASGGKLPGGKSSSSCVSA
jgi:hypothetical protein